MRKFNPAAQTEDDIQDDIKYAQISAAQLGDKFKREFVAGELHEAIRTNDPDFIETREDGRWLVVKWDDLEFAVRLDQ